MRISLQSTAVSISRLLVAALCGFSSCEKRAVDEQATRHAAEGDALEKFKSEAANLTEWARERRPKREWPPAVAVESRFVTNLETRLSALADKNLPDDLEEALDQYIRAFSKHPDLTMPDMHPRQIGIFNARGNQLEAFAAGMTPVKARLGAAAEKYGVDLDDLLEEW